MKHILRCTKCEQFTMKKEHCGAVTISSKPAKWSPQDKYGSYRRQVKKQQGLL